MKDDKRCLEMQYWRLRFGDHESARDKEVRLYKNGWIGETLSPLSPYEIKRCKAFLKQQQSDIFWRKSEYDKEVYSHGFLDAIEWSVWFKEPLDHARFVLLLDSIPPRVNYYTVTHPLIDLDDVVDRLTGKNWGVFSTTNAHVLSVQELSSTDDVWLRLRLES